MRIDDVPPSPSVKAHPPPWYGSAYLGVIKRAMAQAATTIARLRAKTKKKEDQTSFMQFENWGQARIQELMLFSKPLFTFAYKWAQEVGRGCVLVQPDA
jgi:hypothetical protein